ncbi:MAG: rbfA, partial [Marmoricola sp.]|nr:rbfA [Marmoricola sp.]
AAALESAKGLIRSEIGKQLGMRHVPTIEFFHDALPETARAIDDLLDVARAQDAAVAAVRTGAAYAGESDPYKKPRVEDDDEDSGEVAAKVTAEDDADDADHAGDA